MSTKFNTVVIESFILNRYYVFCHILDLFHFAPEMLRSYLENQPIVRRPESDIFSAGSVMLQILTREPLFLNSTLLPKGTRRGTVIDVSLVKYIFQYKMQFIEILQRIAYPESTSTLLRSSPDNRGDLKTIEGFSELI